MRKQTEEMGMNMTPMIDVVFQLIIFFVVTIAQQQKLIEVELRLAMAPDGKAVEKRDPRTVTVDVDDKGKIYILKQRMAQGTLRSILRQGVARYEQSLPVVIRADGKARHDDVRRVVDACTEAGIWKIKFAAIKEKAGK